MSFFLNPLLVGTISNLTRSSELMEWELLTCQRILSEIHDRTSKLLPLNACRWYIYIYIYIYVCVCVCVCVTLFTQQLLYKSIYTFVTLSTHDIPPLFLRYLYIKKHLQSKCFECYLELRVKSIGHVMRCSWLDTCDGLAPRTVLDLFIQISLLLLLCYVTFAIGGALLNELIITLCTLCSSWIILSL